MKAALRAAVAFAIVIATTAFAGEDEPQRAPRLSCRRKPRGSSRSPRTPQSSAAAKTTRRRSRSADRGPLHLEARYNYESVGARSAFVGWTFSGGEAITWELTPLLGGAWGTTQAFVPGLEASVAWRRLDFYVEAEYVRDSSERSNSYFYAWSELGFRPVEWLRIGLAGQRTTAYGGDRECSAGRSRR